MDQPTQVERRKNARFTPDHVRVWCVSGEFEELYTTINFATRLVNLGLKGVCVETTGRLRPDVKMSVEVRFEDLGGTLRSLAKIVWVESLKEKGREVHLAGLEFYGPMDITTPVRDYLQGARRTEIRERRRAEYKDLKQKAMTRPEAPRNRGLLRKSFAVLLLLLFVYVGSYWGWVLQGRIGGPDGPMTYRFFEPESKRDRAEEMLAKLYHPVYWILRQAGADLVYVPRPASD